MSPAVKYSPAARLRLLADWFDVYDECDRAGRVRLLADPRSPGSHGVGADLRAIAKSLPRDWADQAQKLRIIALWFEASPAAIGNTLDERPAPAGTRSDAVQRDLRKIAAKLEARAKAN